MSSVLLCATPNYGHVTPMLAIGRNLVDHGHDVAVVTGSRFGDAVRAGGMTHVPLTGPADYDDRDQASFLPDREKYRGIAQAQYDIQTMFIRTIPSQYATVQQAIAERSSDVVMGDIAFLGVAPLLTAGPSGRPPVIGIGVLPLSYSTPEVAPYGMGLQPGRSAATRLRNRMLQLLLSKVVFRRTQQLAQQMMAEVGAAPLTGWVMDFTGSFDRFLQLTVPEFEYPRALPPSVEFVGPVLPASAGGGAALPPWWGDLAAAGSVVHVSQGTMDNRDLTRLIIPTIRAAADKRDLLLVVSTGRADGEAELVAALGELPANVRVAAYLPYDRLLPQVDVMITNGGYGGVQQALAHGIPLIAAGDTEDKPEVCARIAYSGAGVDLKTGTPTVEAVSAAIDRVRAGAGYRAAARRIAESMARYDALAAIERHVVAANPVVDSREA
ncbi:glycosyltransferase [Gryllotalpicola ginsengisoli]|uniref:glycosyltransferase n=1 Tax=Gryllotalpicola ginsengisoli TaxID=444608 RepID=UPI0003B49300|nr:nucleotide disphospho-sugar-binding domain-containing protein [Gryllotalpicola ginsengisoli]